MTQNYWKSTIVGSFQKNFSLKENFRKYVCLQSYDIPDFTALLLKLELNVDKS